MKLVRWDKYSGQGAQKNANISENDGPTVVRTVYFVWLNWLGFKKFGLALSRPLDGIYRDISKFYLGVYNVS